MSLATITIYNNRLDMSSLFYRFSRFFLARIESHCDIEFATFWTLVFHARTCAPKSSIAKLTL